MAIPGFTGAASFERSTAHAGRRRRILPRWPLEPAQYGELFENTIDELSRSTRRVQPPICFPLPAGLTKGCHQEAAIECISECIGTGEQFHQLCLDQCLSRRYRHCDMMKQICLPVRTSRRGDV
jgi:hypothetical protein